MDWVLAFIHPWYAHGEALISVFLVDHLWKLEAHYFEMSHKTRIDPNLCLDSNDYTLKH